MRAPLPRVSRRGRVTLVVVACVIVLLMLLSWIVSAWTDWLWFSEVKYTSVFTTVLWTRLLLFVVFGLVVGLVLAGNLYLAYRLRPPLRPRSSEQQTLDRYRMLLSPRIGLWIGLLCALVAFFAGVSAQGQWQQWLLFRNAQPFHITDPQFGYDLSFYVFKYPFWRYLTGVGFTTVVLCLIGALGVHYLFGGVRLQGSGERMTFSARAHLTALVAAFVLLKAVAYVLDQRGLLLAHNDTTDLYGAGYTAVNALLPAKEILAWISVVVAVAIILFSNAVIRNLVWPGIAVGLLVISAIAIGGIYPAAIQYATVKPNIRDKEATYIQRSIDATRAAYGLDSVEVQTYPATTTVPPSDIGSDAGTVSNIRLIDPSIVSSTYTQLEQVRAFYDFGEKLDIDRYTINGKLQDYAVGIRELDYNALSGQQNNWQNRTSIYTHGYGFVAAPANQIVCDGKPYFVSGFLGAPAETNGCSSTTEQIAAKQPRIYYGENMDGYAIVGKAPGGKDAEYDRPVDVTSNDSSQQSGTSDQYVTYDGSGGVSVGSYWRRILYAAKYKETNFLISSIFNKNSKILYVRDPRDRVEKVAPFLTIDGDPYPAVVDGKILWILDGYTTASTYPYSSTIDLKSATNDSLTGTGTFAQEQQNINYLRNSVKATVDAYTGEVKLYQFDDNDPVLKAWNKAFGGKLLQPKSAISPDLAAHFRYPEDQFKVQRDLLQRFHVTDPRQFYSGQDFWQVPTDPSQEGTALKQPPYYLLAKFPGQDSPTFQLTAAMTPRNRQNLASVVTGSYQNGQPRLQVLQLPSDTATQGPNQVQNKITSNADISKDLNLFRSQNSEPVFGNMLSLPIGGGMLYVEPLYLRGKANSGFPFLRKVIVNFGDSVGYADTLADAIAQMVQSATGQAPPANPPPGNNPPSTASPSPTTPSNQAVSDALANVQKAIDELKSAQQSGDIEAWGKALKDLNDAINAYQAAVKANPTPTSTPPATPTPTPNPTQSPAG